MFSKISCLTLLWLVVAVSTGISEIYQWTDSSGVKHFSTSYPTEQPIIEDVMEEQLSSAATGGDIFSMWSSPVNGLQVRIYVPRTITPVSGDIFQIYVGVEIKNAGNNTATVTHDARIWAKDGTTQARTKCLKNTIVRPKAILAPGETTQWVQEGVLQATGRYLVSVTLEGDPAVKSLEMETEMMAPVASNFKSAKEKIQTIVRSLPEIPVNTQPGSISYREIVLNKENITLNGVHYTGFKFKVPSEGDLVWSFNVNNSLRTWCIVPETGTMKGFFDFTSRKLSRTIKGVGLEGENVIFQYLPGNSLSSSRKYELEPGRNYIIMFRIGTDMPIPFKLSLNILKKGFPQWDRYFPEVYTASK